MKTLVVLCICLNLIGCSTYQTVVAPIKDDVRLKNFDHAIQLLEPLASKDGADQLVYLLDYATLLQIKGDYKSSTIQFQKADRLADSLDYISISKQAGSLLLSQDVVQYQGDTFEKFFINSMNALNYLALDQPDEALVEVRRMNERYSKLSHENRKDFELNFFSSYLSGLIYESTKNYDDAYISFKKSFEIDPTQDFLREDLIRMAKLSRRDDEYKKWKKTWPDIIEEPDWYNSRKAKVTVIQLNGWGPIKVPDPGEPRLPRLQSVYSETQSGEIFRDSKKIAETQMIYDVDRIARQTWQDDIAVAALKRVGGLATKAIISDQVRQKNQALGNILWIALLITERADVRNWTLLPREIRLAKVYLDAGDRELQFRPVQFSGVIPSESTSVTRQFSLKNGDHKFWILRTSE